MVNKTIRGIAAVLLCIAGGGSQAQTDLQNNGTLYISGASDILYISGSFTNASGAALTNNGSLYVLQNLINGQPSMAAGTGTLYLNGSSAQSLGGAQPFKTFNFVSNNSAGITLNNDLSVSGVHTFTAGLIASSATPNYLVYEAGSSYTGDGDARHVSGWVRKNGSTSFVFPVGNNTVERVIGLSNLSATSGFNVSYAGATTNTHNLNSPLVSVSSAEYWQVNQVSGGSAQVAMNWNNSKVAFPPYVLADIRVANYSAAKWNAIGSGGATGNVTTTGSITSPSVSSFGPFVLGSVSTALPVNLVNFTASHAPGYNLVTWSTSDELNMQQYEVQRSDDGRSFYIAGAVAARHLASLQQYELKDGKPMGSVAWYRLRSVDMDGQSKLSGVVAVYDRSLQSNYFAVTNPAHGLLQLSAGSMYNGDYEYHILTSSGQTVQAGRLSIVNGGYYQVPLMPVVVHGVYIVEFRKGDFSYRERVLVQ